MADRACPLSALYPGVVTLPHVGRLWRCVYGATTAAFVSDGIDLDPWIAHVGLGYVHQVSDTTSFTANDDAEYRDDLLNQSAPGTMRRAIKRIFSVFTKEHLIYYVFSSPRKRGSSKIKQVDWLHRCLRRSCLRGNDELIRGSLTFRWLVSTGSFSFSAKEIQDFMS